MNLFNISAVCDNAFQDERNVQTCIQKLMLVVENVEMYLQKQYHKLLDVCNGTK